MIFLGNIPPCVIFPCWSLLLQSNRFLVEYKTTKNLSIIKRIKINYERIIFKLFKGNVDKIIVQSRSMKELVDKKNYLLNSKIIAYKNNLSELNTNLTKKYDFIYIASDELYKNHINLLIAWEKLYCQNIISSLCLVLPKESYVKKIVDSLKIKNKKIKIYVFEEINRDEAMKLLKQSRALVFPSKYESYGLPIVEAYLNNLKIIASEKDYVRDLIDPNETFDPDSPHSIYRAIKRFLKQCDEKTKIVDASHFIDFVIAKGK